MVNNKYNYAKKTAHICNFEFKKKYSHFTYNSEINVKQSIKYEHIWSAIESVIAASRSITNTESPFGTIRIKFHSENSDKCPLSMMPPL